MSVISPWLFYIIDLLDKFYVCICVVFWGAVIILCGTLLFWLLESYELEEDDILTVKKVIKLSVIPIVISSVMYVAIPSKDTMYKMLVAKYVTYENIDKATDTIKDGVDYIFEKLDGGKDKDK